MSRLSLEIQKLKCGRCGLWNEIVAIDCGRCKASLVDETSSAWFASRTKAAVREVSENEAGDRKAAVIRFAVIMAILFVVVSVVSYSVRYIQENVYVFDAPRHEGETIPVWLARLESEDVYMRRRAAEAMDAMATYVKRPSMAEMMPGLEAAANDDDEIVRFHVVSAIAILKKRFGDSK